VEVVEGVDMREDFWVLVFLATVIGLFLGLSYLFVKMWVL